MILLDWDHCDEGFPGGAGGKEPTCQCRRRKRRGFNLWVRKMPWRRAWQPTPGFLPGESHGQRSLAGYSPWGCKEIQLQRLGTHIGTAVMGEPFVHFSRAPGPGRQWRMESSLPTTCPATHNCSGLLRPHQQSIFTNLPAWPQAVYPEMAFAHRTSHRVTEQATSSSDESHMHWVPSTFFFPKVGESAKSLLNRIPVSSEHGSRFSPGGIRNTHSPHLV